MDLETFVQKAIDNLNNTQIDDNRQAQAIFRELMKPLTESYWVYADIIKIPRTNSFFGAVGVKMPMPQCQVGAYLETVEKRLEIRHELIQRNATVNPLYRNPSMDIDQAAEIAEESLSESLGKHAESYRPIFEGKTLPAIPVAANVYSHFEELFCNGLTGEFAAGNDTSAQNTNP